MWHIRAVFIAMAGILLILVPEVRGDSLQLKNGNFVQGKYLGGTERAVQFEVNGKIRLYDTGEILSISFAAASADGGIPSDSAERKPGANTESNSAEKNNSRLRNTVWDQTNAPKIAALRIEEETSPVKLNPSGSSGAVSGRELRVRDRRRAAVPAPAIGVRVEIPRLAVVSDRLEASIPPRSQNGFPRRRW